MVDDHHLRAFAAVAEELSLRRSWDSQSAATMTPPSAIVHLVPILRMTPAAMEPPNVTNKAIGHRYASNSPGC
jgi:hypothetical protein